MHTDGQAAVNRPRGMLINTSAVLADGWRAVDVFGTLRYGGTHQKCNRLIKQRHVTCSPQIVHTSVGQPQQVIRKMCTHTIAQRRVPPVLDITRFELAGSANNDLLAEHPGCCPSQGQGVLQLISKASGPARLIEPGFGPQPARDRLVKKPAIHHGIKQRVGCLDLRRTQKTVPGQAHLGQSVWRTDLACKGSQFPGSLWTIGVPQQKGNRHRVA